jgi:glycosyltransferase involved in cell wall biosynthesis
MFAAAGLHVFEVRGRDIANAGFEQWRETQLFSGHDERAWRAYQFVVRATALKPRPLHIHAITSSTVCVPVRIEQPLQALQTVPGVRCFVTDSGGPELVFPADTDVVLILQRLVEEPAEYLAAIRRLIDTYPRLVVVYEIDDDPEAAPGMVASDYLPLRLCHAVQCSTEVVAESVRPFNPNVAVFPNQIAELPEWEPKERPESTRGDVYVFFGAMNRAADWLPIMPALNRVIADHPELWFAVVHDRAFFDALETDRKHFKPTLPYPEYLAALRWCDIALLPLEPTRFNRHKSDLKFLEAAANKVAVLASETVYGEVIWSPTQEICGKLVKGPTGALYRDQPMFETWLRTLIEEPEMRRTFAANAYDYIKEIRMLRYRYKDRYRWYRHLLGTRATLDCDLRDRCPELACDRQAAEPPGPGPTGTRPSPA